MDITESRVGEIPSKKQEKIEVSDDILNDPLPIYLLKKPSMVTGFIVGMYSYHSDIVSEILIPILVAFLGFQLLSLLYKWENSEEISLVKNWDYIIKNSILATIFSLAVFLVFYLIGFILLGPVMPSTF